MQTKSISRWVLAATLMVAALLLVAGAGMAQKEDAAALKARMKKLDAGPKTVDVSKYPAEMKTNYAVFQKKCVKCHSLARPVNTQFVLPSEWERYIKRMVYKPDSKMTDADGKAIYRFLTYDSSVRKAASLRAHLAALSEHEREEAIGKVKAVNPGFDMAGK